MSEHVIKKYIFLYQISTFNVVGAIYELMVEQLVVKID